jgi:hypothetical protein
MALPAYQKKLKNIFSTPKEDINQMSLSEYLFLLCLLFHLLISSYSSDDAHNDI